MLCFLVDTETHRIRVIHEGLGLYYGVCRHEGQIAVAARRRLTGDETEIEAERGCIVFLNPNGSDVGIWESTIPLRDLHGIASIDGKLWCTCSYDNGIAVLDNSSSSMFFPLGRPDNPPYDVNHVNTLKQIGLQIYIVAHNNGKSKLHTIDRDTLKSINSVELGIFSHDIWFDGPDMRTCSSGESSIVGSNGFKKQIGGFPRGHIQSGNMHIFGVTEHKTRKERDASTSKIIVTGPNYDALDIIELPGFGMVLDMLELNRSDFRISLFNSLRLAISGGVRRRLGMARSTHAA